MDRYDRNFCNKIWERIPPYKGLGGVGYGTVQPESAAKANEWFEGKLGGNGRRVNDLFSQFPHLGAPDGCNTGPVQGRILIVSISKW